MGRLKPAAAVGTTLLLLTFLLQCQGKMNEREKAASDSEPRIHSLICVTPKDDLKITRDTMLCKGTYYLNDKNNDGVIKIAANNVALDCNGAKLIGNGSGIGVYSRGKNNVTIKNCNVSNYNDALHLAPTSNSTVIGNDLSYYYNDGILIVGNNNIIQNNLIRVTGSDSTWAAIFINYSKNTLIQNNSIRNINGGFPPPPNTLPTGFAIMVQNSDKTKILNNIIYNAYHGINVVYSVNSNISHNKISAKKFGHCTVEIGSGAGTVTENTEIAYNYIDAPRYVAGISSHSGQKNSKVHDNKIKVAGSGLSCYGNVFGDGCDCEGLIAYNNEVEGCENAIDLQKERNSVFYRNVLNCKNAFFTQYYAENNSIYDNIFNVSNIGSTSAFSLNNKFNTAKDYLETNIIGGKCVGGNYWGLYHGVDTNGDGIGEKPFVIDKSLGLYDHLPLTNVHPH